MMCMSVLCAAQKKELAQARTYLKSGKELEKAEKLMTDLLQKDSVNRQNKKIWLTWLESVEKQYEAANEQLYLNRKYDTAVFFNLTRKMYAIAESLDSLDARPDKKGRVRPEYRKGHAEFLNQLRPNLYGGGTYQLKKGDHDKAFDFFDVYIGADSQPLFEGYHYMKTDSLMPLAAYWATFCGFRKQDAAMTLKYAKLALQDQSKKHFTLQYISEAYRLQKDQKRYVESLRSGFEQYPESPYFFPRLADFYTQLARHDSVLVLTERGLAVNAENTLFLLAKSIALMHLERFDECIEISRQLIALNDALPEPYFNISTIYLNKALVLERMNEPRKYRKQLTQLYTNARPMMEKYRELMPDDSSRWGPALYRIYLYLNMGKQFEEIDRLMRNN